MALENCHGSLLFVQLFQNYELILTEEQYKLVKRESGGLMPYRIHQMGIYLMIEIQKGLIVLWDKRTTVFIKLGAEFKVRYNLKDILSIYLMQN